MANSVSKSSFEGVEQYSYQISEEDEDPMLFEAEQKKNYKLVSREWTSALMLCLLIYISILETLKLSQQPLPKHAQHCLELPYCK
jgi:hypothetical protein